MRGEGPYALASWRTQQGKSVASFVYRMDKLVSENQISKLLCGKPTVLNFQGKYP